MKFAPIASAALASLLAFGSANAAEYDLGDDLGSAPTPTGSAEEVEKPICFGRTVNSGIADTSGF
jgi:hypothetical protein